MWVIVPIAAYTLLLRAVLLRPVDMLANLQPEQLDESAVVQELASEFLLADAYLRDHAGRMNKVLFFVIIPLIFADGMLLTAIVELFVSAPIDRPSFLSAVGMVSDVLLCLATNLVILVGIASVNSIRR